MEKIKIIYIISSLRRCGPVNVLANIINNINLDVFDVYIVALKKEKYNSKKDEFVIDECNIYEMDYSKIYMQIYGKKELRNIIEKIGPHIIHTHCFRSSVYASSLAGEYVICTTIHNYPHQDYVYTYGQILGFFMYKLYFYAINKMQARISCSESIRKELEKNFLIQSECIRNGIAPITVPKLSGVLSYDMKKKLGLRYNKRVLISVGNLTSGKNPCFIIKAFLNSQLNDWILLFVGDGPLKSKCMNLAKDKNIFFTGSVKNVSEYLSVADVFVSASSSEGMPNAVLEAMNIGLPILLSDIEPHKEIYKLNILSGKLFKNNNVEDFCFNFKKIIDGDYLEQSLMAKKIVEENFLAKMMSNAYQNLYKKLANVTLDKKK